MEPYVEAERIAYEGDKWAESRPVCVECEEQIIDDKCYVFDEFAPREACMCADCFTRRMISLKNEWLIELLGDAASVFWRSTPE